MCFSQLMSDKCWCRARRIHCDWLAILNVTFGDIANMLNLHNVTGSTFQYLFLSKPAKLPRITRKIIIIQLISEINREVQLLTIK